MSLTLWPISTYNPQEEVLWGQLPGAGGAEQWAGGVVNGVGWAPAVYVLSTTTMPVVITSHFALTPSYTGMPLPVPCLASSYSSFKVQLSTASSRQPSMSPIKHPPLQSPHCPAVFIAMTFFLPPRTASSCRRRTSPWFSVRAQAVRNQGETGWWQD